MEEKNRGEVRGENGQVARMAANVFTMDTLGKWNGTFDGWG